MLFANFSYLTRSLIWPLKAVEFGVIINPQYSDLQTGIFFKIQNDRFTTLIDEEWVGDKSHDAKHIHDANYMMQGVLCCWWSSSNVYSKEMWDG